MSSADGHSAPRSKETSPRAGSDDARLSDAEYLARQEEIARTAMQGALRDLRANLKTAISPQQWAQRYPWASAGVAAAAGFAAAALLKSASHGTRSKHAEAAAKVETPAEANPRPATGISSRLLELVWDLLRTASLGYVGMAIRSTADRAAGAPSAAEQGETVGIR
jgi:hypothetical protein